MAPQIRGADAVVSWFGVWPTFHDAEVLAFHVNRGGTSLIRLRAWLRSDSAGEDGYFIREREAEVIFEMREIISLRLEGEHADVQNVICGLRIDVRPDLTVLTLEPCYGLAGEISIKHLAVHVAPLRDP